MIMTQHTQEAWFIKSTVKWAYSYMLLYVIFMHKNYLNSFIFLDPPLLSLFITQLYEIWPVYMRLLQTFLLHSTPLDPPLLAKVSFFLFFLHNLQLCINAKDAQIRFVSVCNTAPLQHYIQSIASLYQKHIPLNFCCEYILLEQHGHHWIQQKVLV